MKTNVQPGDLAYVVYESYKQGFSVDPPKLPFVEVIRRFTGDSWTVATPKGIYELEPDKLAVCWIVKSKEPFPLLYHPVSNRWHYVHEFPIKDYVLRKITGPGIVSEDELEIFSPNPINSEERVTVKERNHEKGTVKS